METITGRTQIAKALNFGKYPVLYLDLGKDEIKKDYAKGCYEGQRVKIKNFYNGSHYYTYGNLSYWADTNKLEIIQGGTCLKAGFGYSDIEEMVMNANSTEIEPEQEVIVVIFDSTRRVTAYPVLTKTSKHDPHCQVPMVIEGDFRYIIERVKGI